MGALLWTWEKKHRAEHRCSSEEIRLKSGRKKKKKSMSGEGTAHTILPLQRKRAAKTTSRGEQHHWEILRRGNPPQIEKKKKSLKTALHTILKLKRKRAAKTTSRDKQHHWESLRTVCACWGQPLLRERNKPNTGLRGITLCFFFFFTITHLLTRASLCRSISRMRTLKLPSPFLLPWPCHAPSDFFCFVPTSLAMVDWSWPKEWNCFARANLH